MEYDLNLHIPQQIELFMNAYAAGDINALERVKTNLVNVMGNEGYTKAVKDFDGQKFKIRKDNIKKCLQKAKDAVKELDMLEPGEMPYLDLREIIGDLTSIQEEVDLNLAKSETEYWDKLNEMTMEVIKKKYDKDE